MDLLNDPDYQDYRELICFERPACVLLHYIFNLTTLRTQLYDRFFFERQNDELKSPINALHQFLDMHGVHNEKSVKISSHEELIDILKSHAAQFMANTALIIPYFNQIGSSRVLSTWLVEFSAENSSACFLTSLRGDDFYFRKAVDLKTVVEKIYISDGIFKFQTLQFSDDLIALKTLSPADLFNESGIALKLKNLAQSFVASRVSGKIMGSHALWQEYKSNIKTFEYWKNLVDEGFQKALLVKLFWPIQFYYQPFAVFLKYCLVNEIYGQESEFRSACQNLIHELTKNAQILTSISGIFAYRRDKGSFDRFCRSMEHSLSIYEKLEELFLKYELQCCDTINLSESVTFFSEATAQFLKVGLLPQIKKDTDSRNFFPISDSTVPNSDKFFIRTLLKKTPYHVEHTFSASFDPESFRGIAFPFVLKSSVGFASGGTFLVNSENDLKLKLKAIKNLNRFIFTRKSKTNMGVLAEKFIYGAEYAAECITVNGRTKLIGLFSKPANSEKDFTDSVYLLDFRVQADLSEKVQAWISGLLTSVDYIQGPSHVEFRIDSQTEMPSLIEINFRPGGSGILATLIYLETGIPVLGLMGQAITGQLTWQDLKKVHLNTEAFLFCVIPKVEKSGIIKCIRGQNLLNKNPSILWSHFLKKPGQAITPPPWGTDYLGMILGKSSSSQNLSNTLNFIATHVGIDYESN